MGVPPLGGRWKASLRPSASPAWMQPSSAGRWPRHGRRVLPGLDLPPHAVDDLGVALRRELARGHGWRIVAGGRAQRRRQNHRAHPRTHPNSPRSFVLSREYVEDCDSRSDCGQCRPSATARKTATITPPRAARRGGRRPGHHGRDQRGRPRPAGENAPGHGADRARHVRPDHGLELVEERKDAGPWSRKYRVTFGRAARYWRFDLGPDGKIVGLQPVPE